jgi:hypothetical protein
MGSYHGGRGRGQWFAVPGGVAWSGGAGDRSTLAQATASRAPEPWMIRWDAAEAAAREVLLRVHPTQEAERRRQNVVGYLKRLIGSAFGFEVRALPSLFPPTRCGYLSVVDRPPRRARRVRFFWGGGKKRFFFRGMKRRLAFCSFGVAVCGGFHSGPGASEIPVAACARCFPSLSPGMTTSMIKVD